MSPQDPVPRFPKNYEEAIIFLQAVANMREEVPLPTDTNNLHGLWRAIFWKLNGVLGRTGASRLDVKHWRYLKESVPGAEELFRWASHNLKADATFRGFDSKARPHVATFLQLVDPRTAPEFEEHRRRVEELYAPQTPQMASKGPSSSSGSIPSGTATNAIGPSSHPHSIYSGVFSNPDSNASLTPSGSATNEVMNISAHSRKPSASRLSTSRGTIPESDSTSMTAPGSQISHVSSVSRPSEGKRKNPSARMSIGEQQLYFDTPLLAEAVTDSQSKADQKPAAKGDGKRKRDVGESPTKAVAPRKRAKTAKTQGPVPAQLPPTPQWNRATATPLGRGVPQVLDASQYLDPFQFVNTPPSLDSTRSASRYHNVMPHAMDHLRTLSRSQALASPSLSESRSYGSRIASPYTATNADSPVTVQQANVLFDTFNSGIYEFEVPSNAVVSASTPGRSSVKTKLPDIQSSALFSQGPPFTLGIETLPWQPSLANPSTSTAIHEVSYPAGGPGSSASVETAAGTGSGGTVKEPSFIDDVNYLAGFLYHSRYGGEHASLDAIAAMHTMVREKIFLGNPALWAEWKVWLLRGRELVAKSPHIYVETKPSS